MWLISINIQLSNRKFLIFSFQFFTFSFVHFCFLSVSEARSFLLYSKYKGRKILAIEFKHLHSKLFQINLFDFSFKCSSENIWVPRRLCHLVRRLSSIFFHVLQFLIMFSPAPGCYFGTKSRYFETKIHLGKSRSLESLQNHVNPSEFSNHEIESSKNIIPK